MNAVRGVCHLFPPLASYNALANNSSGTPPSLALHEPAAVFMSRSHEQERDRDRPSSRDGRGARPADLRWRVDHDKGVLVSNFERRGWPRSAEDGEWNFYWASPYSVKQIFNPENNIRLADQQVINHFPNHYELTRKDLMVKNLKRYMKELERVNAERAAELGCAAPELDLECMPTTFILPADFSLFAEESRKQEQAGDRRQMWIMKPTSKSRGIGIFIINRLSQARQSGSQPSPHS